MRFKRSSLVMKIVLLAMVVYATVTLVSLQSQVTQKNAEAAELQSSIDVEKQENLRLQQAIENLNTDEGVQEVAREKLGWVSKGEIVFYDMGR